MITSHFDLLAFQNYDYSSRSPAKSYSNFVCKLRRKQRFSVGRRELIRSPV